MREAINDWKKTTVLITKLARITDESRREEVLQTIDAQLEKREQLLPHLIPLFTDIEAAEKERLIQLESDMNEALKKFREVLKEELFTMKAKKGTVKNYVNPYDKVARDGTYYDTKQ